LKTVRSDYVAKAGKQGARRVSLVSSNEAVATTGHEEASKSADKAVSIQPRYALTSALIKDMERFFVSQQALCRVLKTTPKTWRDMRGSEGVRENTAEQTIIQFITVLWRTADGRDPLRLEINELLVAPLAKKYAACVEKADFSEFMEKLDVGVNESSVDKSEVMSDRPLSPKQFVEQ
jgi:hypothetical protein